MDQVEVTDDGVEVHLESPPLVSMYGKVMREGGTFTTMLPWPEISAITLAATQLPPDGRHWISLEIDLTWGEFLNVGEGTAGFATAVAGIAARSGAPVPDLSTFEGELSLWP